MIMIWAPNFAPQDWAFCAGQQIQIQQNQALFALIGVTYGGNASSHFNLPDLQGRFPIGAGNAPGGSNYVLGQAHGQETTTLNVTNLPQHTHDAGSLAASPQAWATRATDHNPANGKGLAASTAGTSPTSPPGNSYADPSGDPVNLAGGSVQGTTGMAGNSLPFSNMPPYLVLNFCIALNGLFPPRQ
ncbi:MAG: phage tail protein [Salinarimonas sp.]